MTRLVAIHIGAAAVIAGLAGYAMGTEDVADGGTYYPPVLTDPTPIPPTEWHTLSGPPAVSPRPTMRPDLYGGVAIYRAPTVRGWPAHWMIEDRQGAAWCMHEFCNLTPKGGDADAKARTRAGPGVSGTHAPTEASHDHREVGRDRDAGATVPVPLPGGAWLMGAAIGLLINFGRRRI